MNWLYKTLLRRAERLRSEGWLEATMAHSHSIDHAYKMRDEMSEKYNMLRNYCFVIGGDPDKMKPK